MTVEIIRETENYRIVVEQDLDCHGESPRDWQDGVSCYPLALNSGYYAPKPGQNTREYAIDTILEHTADGQRWTGSGWAITDDTRAALGRHFDRAGIAYRIDDLTADRDWVGEFLWYVEPETAAMSRELNPDWDQAAFLTGCIREYEQWARGEVYIVALQERVDWQADGYPQRHTWETIEALGSCYLTDDYTAEDVVREFEHAALATLLTEGIVA